MQEWNFGSLADQFPRGTDFLVAAVQSAVIEFSKVGTTGRATAEQHFSNDIVREIGHTLSMTFPLTDFAADGPSNF